MRIGRSVVRVLGRGLVSAPERERLAGLRYADAGHGYDLFGLHPDWVMLAEGLLGPFYDHYFRVSSYDAQHLPQSGAAILVANHAGTLPIDALMLGLSVLRHTDPPRMLRVVGDYLVPRLPVFGSLASRVGMVNGARGNVRRLLEDGELCLIFPEGTPGIGKPWRERYQLRDFRVGHAELALRHGVPVIPVAVIGSEEQWPRIARIDRWKPFGAPFLPVFATPFPLPVHFHIQYGRPIDLRAVTAGCTTEADGLRRAAEATRAAVQALIDFRLAQRKSVFL
jgi:1-acyl-sn-glycerol-3-phosphate acyltransferase